MNIFGIKYYYIFRYYLNQRWDENRESLFAYIEQVKTFKSLFLSNLNEKIYILCYKIYL